MSDLYVDTATALEQLCAQLQDSPWIALDTEFIREKTYYPQLCLLQVANAEHVACVDVLALNDLTPLLEVLYDPASTKILHSAYQDLEIFFNLRAALPSPVFDTQLAATLLGLGEHIGYGNLVKTLLGVELDKSQTRTDWSRRPLDPAQLAYAADDVRYLSRLYHRQQEELERRQRSAWLTEDFRALCDPGSYQIDSHLLWQRIKGHQQLRGIQLAVLRTLAAWREEQARTLDRPRRWILGDDVLLELARHPPKDMARLSRTRGLASGFIKRHGQTLLELIDATRQEPRQHWPKIAPHKHLSLSQDALVDAMMAVVRLRGAETAVSPSSLANRKDLELLIQGADIPLLHGWRAAIAGCEIQSLLSGKLGLEVRDGQLRTAPITPY